ncbi:hypothetical protein ATO13_09266 [Stappia sp. 22II-S9-Z10]|nr:hypothetical protein ATO13_09266 [Stappia sp. 22II-S9-Z10]
MPADARRDFVALVEAALAKSMRRIAFADFARAGREMGVLTPQEITDCQRGSKLPDWTLAALGTAQDIITADGLARTDSIREPFGPDSPPAHAVIAPAVIAPVTAPAAAAAASPVAPAAPAVPPVAAAAPVAPADAAPTTAPPAAATAPAAASGALPRPAVASHGGPLRLSVHNHNRLALAGDAVVPALSNPRAHWLIPRVRAAEGVPHLTGHTIDAVVEGGPLFSHFLFDAVPKLLALRQRLDPARADHILFTSLRSPFHTETLERLGIDPARCLTREEHGALFDVERVTWVRPLRRGGKTSAGLYEAVRTLFGADTATGGPRRIYISRGKAKRRRLLNEADILPALARHGYEVVNFEDHGVAGAARLLAGAEHIVGLHGAGFANMVFAPATCRVTELHGPHCSAEYRDIAAIRGMPYDRLDCGRGGHDFAGDSFAMSYSDVTVDPAAFAALLLP